MEYGLRLCAEILIKSREETILSDCLSPKGAVSHLVLPVVQNEKSQTINSHSKMYDPDFMKKILISKDKILKHKLIG